MVKKRKKIVKKIFFGVLNLFRYQVVYDYHTIPSRIMLQKYLYDEDKQKITNIINKELSNETFTKEIN